MRTSTNYLILNMACGDLVAIIVTVPFTAFTLYTGTNFVSSLTTGNGLLTCKIKRYLFFVSLFCSIFSLVAITIDRFLAVIRPLVYTHGNRWNKMAIPMVWLASLMLPLHHVVKTVNLEVRNNPGNRTFCSKSKSLTDAISFISLGYVVPHIIMIVLYVAIALKLHKRRIPGERNSTGNQHSNNKAKRSAKKVTRMIVCIILAFDVCWAPLFFIYIEPYMLDKLLEENAEYQISAKILMIFNGTSNALIYAIFNEKFRRAFKSSLSLSCVTS